MYVWPEASVRPYVPAGGVWREAIGSCVGSGTALGGGGGGEAGTVTSAVPLLPSLAAVMVAGPAATPSTSPVELTVATLAADVDHEIVLPLSTAPFASLSVAVSWVVAPT